MVPVLQGMYNTVKLHVSTPKSPQTSVKNLGFSLLSLSSKSQKDGP